MTAAAALPLALLVPLAGAGLIALAGRWPNLREAVTLVTASALFVCTLVVLDAVAAGAAPALYLFELVPSLPIAFRVEPLGALFAAVASGLWIVTSLYSIGYMRGNHERHQTRFYVYFALALASTMGIAFAANMFTLFLFYEALTLSTYPLVAHHGDDEARAGGRTYLGLLLGTSIGLLLVAIVWTWAIAGTLDFRSGGILAGRVSPSFAAILLALYMFGIGKAALMPFHRWLPAAMVAPTPVSALLHAVAVVKAGVFTVLKVAVYIFGIDFLAETGASDWLAWVAAASLLLASLVALTKDNLKARLAYSTISQLAYITLGAAMASSLGIVGGGLHILMHAFGKITLFMCAGAIYVATHKTEISDMQGLGRAMPFTFGAFLLGSLSIIGLPPFGGTWSKYYLMLGALEADKAILIAVLMLSSLLSIAYLLPVVARGLFLPAPRPRALGAAASAAPHRSGIREAPLLCVLPPWIAALGCIVLFFYVEPIAAFLGRIVEVVP